MECRLLLLEVVAVLAAATLLLGASHKPWAQLLEGGEGDLVRREALTEERVQRRLLGIDDECLRRLVQPNAKAPSHGITLGWATSALAVIQLLHPWARCLSDLIASRLAWFRAQ